jgi:molecular chaperone DnaJ
VASAKDYYAILGVPRDADVAEIKRAYRRLARELHPDVNPGSEERFKDVTAAYEVLSDKEKRQMFDMGVDPLNRTAGMPGPGGGGQFGDFSGGFEDLLGAFFGGSSSRGPRPRVRPGADALVETHVTLAEACFGVRQEIPIETAIVCRLCQGAGTAPGTHPATCSTCGGRGEIQQIQRSFLGQVVTARPCHTCSGTGQVIPDPCVECGGGGRVKTRRTLTVDIPAGVDDGMRVRLSGQGEVGPGGGPAGDVYVEVLVEPHPVFTREGADLHARVTVPMTAAALGAGIPFDLLDGTVQTLDVRPGTQSGATLRLRGTGAQRLRSHGRGDTIVHLEVATPTKVDAEQERLLRELAQLRGEDFASGTVEPAHSHGLGKWLKDAFKGR